MTNEQEIAQIFKALSDENRIKILKLLRDGEKCACHLLEALNITQPTLSHHMKLLCDCGVVKSRKEGKWTHYSICCESVCRVRKLMYGLLAPENILADCGCKEA